MPLLFAATLFALQEWVNSTIVTRFIHRYGSAIGIEGRAKRSHALLARGLQYVFSRFLPLIVLLCGAIVIANKVALWSYLQHQEISTFIDENYRGPREQHISAPAKKRNLVLIYVESLEKGYTNRDVMGGDLLAPLNKVTETGTRFDRLMQTTGTGWTIAGIVATQCGVPLKTMSLFNIDNQKAKIKSFLPGLECLGDVLETHGYKNVFMGGASLYFADKGKFFAEHGYSELYGKEEWVRAGAKNFSDWGLYDDELFARAKVRLDQLERAGRPFNLTLLTVDTHPPKGYLSPTCARRGATDYKGILNCTAGLVADFISHMRQKGYLQNTVVVITGDHLSTRAPLEAELNRSTQPRTIFNAFITPTPSRMNRETSYHFGLFPTTLYALGFRFDQNRLGLGASGLGPVDPDFELPDLDFATLNELLAKTSRRYLEFWNASEGDGNLPEQHQKH